MLYLLDANTIIDAHRDYYPVERVPEFWAWLVDMAEAGRVKIPWEIWGEIFQTKSLDPEREVRFQWQRKNRKVLVLDESVQKDLVANVTDTGYADDLTDSEVAEIGRDPFLVAYALADLGNRCVVTMERSKPKAKRANRRLPDVCRDFRVPHCRTFDLIRRLDFRTGGGSARPMI